MIDSFMYLIFVLLILEIRSLESFSFVNCSLSFLMLEANLSNSRQLLAISVFLVLFLLGFGVTLIRPLASNLFIFLFSATTFLFNVDSSAKIFLYSSVS